MLIRFYGCKNAIFYGFCWFFAYFLWEKGPKKFSESKNFFSRKFDPKWFHIYLFELPNSFWPIMLYCLVTLKKSFFPIFPNKLGSSQKVQKPRGAMVFANEVIKILSNLDPKGAKGSEKAIKS